MVETHTKFVVNIYTVMVKLYSWYLLYICRAIVMNFRTYNAVGQ